MNKGGGHHTGTHACTPTNMAKLCSVLGLLNCYRKCVPNLLNAFLHKLSVLLQAGYMYMSRWTAAECVRAC